MTDFTRDELQDLIRKEAKKVLASGEVNAVVGWTATRFDDRTRPCLD